MAKETYPAVELLKQVKGVGHLIALTYVLTIEDPHRFRKSRDAGCFVGLQPGRRNSGDSEPQMHVSKEGDEYLRTLLVPASAPARQCQTVRPVAQPNHRPGPGQGSPETKSGRKAG